MKLKGKTVAIFVEQQYQTLEAWYPYYRLKEEGADVSFIGSGSATMYPSKYGYPVHVDKHIAETDIADYDAIIIPGGFAPDYMRRHPKMIDAIRVADGRGAVIAAICHGPWLLASADILSGKRATCFHAIADDIKNAGALYVDEEVVVDGHLITARKPDDLPSFCLAIIAALSV